MGPNTQQSGFGGFQNPGSFGTMNAGVPNNQLSALRTTQPSQFQGWQVSPYPSEDVMRPGGGFTYDQNVANAKTATPGAPDWISQKLGQYGSTPQITDPTKYGRWAGSQGTMLNPLSGDNRGMGLGTGQGQSLGGLGQGGAVGTLPDQSLPRGGKGGGGGAGSGLPPGGSIGSMPSSNFGAQGFKSQFDPRTPQTGGGIGSMQAGNFGQFGAGGFAAPAGNGGAGGMGSMGSFGQSTNAPSTVQQPTIHGYGAAGTTNDTSVDPGWANVWQGIANQSPTSQAGGVNPYYPGGQSQPATGATQSGAQGIGGLQQGHQPILTAQTGVGAGGGGGNEAQLAQQFIAGMGHPDGQAAMSQLWNQAGGNQQAFNQIINRYSSGGANYDPNAIAAINQGRSATLRGG